MVRANASEYVFSSRPDKCKQMPGHVFIVYRCICSTRDKLGLYAEIQIMIGTVWRSTTKKTKQFVCRYSDYDWDSVA